MSKNEKVEVARAHFKQAQHNLLSVFSRMQFEMANAYNNKWDRVHSEILESTIKDLSEALKFVISTEKKTMVALAAAAGDDIHGPSPADLTEAEMLGKAAH